MIKQRSRRKKEKMCEQRRQREEEGKECVEDVICGNEEGRMNS